MSRINTNVTSLLAQRNLATANAAVNKSMERLSTGLKINRGADDPAGLIASERMRSEKVALTSAITNASRATNLIGTAEGALNEINSLLLDIQGMVNTAANSGVMTQEEVAANQLQIDEALSSINRIAETTQFNGKKLLDGSLGFNTNSVVAGEISSVTVQQATFTGATKSVSVAANATTAAKALITMAEAQIGSAAGTVRIEGNKGAALVQFSTGMNQAAVVNAVNAVKDITGVEAAANATNIDFTSAEFGTSQFIRFSRLESAVFTTSAAYATGANATVTGVDGSATGVSVDGLNVTVKRDGLEMSLRLVGTLNGTSTFNIEQGGATFQVGPQVNVQNQVSVGLQNVRSNFLGSSTGGFLSSLGVGGNNQLSSKNFTAASSVVANAIDQVSSLRGRLGAIQKNTLEASIRSLGTTLENITSAESSIRDTDFAVETANMTRGQILVQAGTSVLAMANQAPQNVLSLLR
jgi:flagellin